MDGPYSVLLSHNEIITYDFMLLECFTLFTVVSDVLRWYVNEGVVDGEADPENERQFIARSGPPSTP